MVNQHDWNTYRAQFPLRYIDEGAFDARLAAVLAERAADTRAALDVGGGVLGTRALQDFAVPRGVAVDMLDPFVNGTPAWMRERIRWEDTGREGQYDVIVARGSINYLVVAQLVQLKRMLAPGGLLIANTFLSPPDTTWRERAATNVQGDRGVERSRLVGDVVEHQLLFPTYTIDHHFFFYPLETYQRAFGQVEVETYAKNSSILLVQN